MQRRYKNLLEKFLGLTIIAPKHFVNLLAYEMATQLRKHRDLAIVRENVF